MEGRERGTKGVRVVKQRNKNNEGEAKIREERGMEGRRKERGREEGREEREGEGERERPSLTPLR